MPGSYTLTIPRPEDPETLKQLSGIVANRNGWHPKGQAAIPVSITVGSAAPAVADAGAVEEEAEVGDGEDPFAITGDAQTKIDEIRSWGVVGLDGEIAKERGHHRSTVYRDLAAMRVTLSGLDLQPAS